MKKGKTEIQEDVKDLEDFYRRMDRDKRMELLREYLGTARYLKVKSDLLFDHVAVMACVTAEEVNMEK